MTTTEGKTIVAITPDGIVYHNADGSEGFIDFNVCYENWARAYFTPENLQRIKALNRMTDEALAQFAERHRSWKQVGVKDFVGELIARGEAYNTCIAFHTEPPTRFIMQNREDHFQLNMAILRAGWQRFDKT